MQVTKARIWVTIAATITAITFLVLASAIPIQATLILSVEVLLLPMIYIVGNLYIEEKIKHEYEIALDVIKNDTNILNQKIYNERLLRTKLEEKLKLYKNANKK